MKTQRKKSKMEKIQDKKISISLFLFAVVNILIFSVIKEKMHYEDSITYEVAPAIEEYSVSGNDVKTYSSEENSTYLQADDVNKSIYYVNIFGLSLKYYSLIVFLIIVIGISIYLFLFKTDKQIRSDLANYKMKISKLRHDLKIRHKSSRDKSISQSSILNPEANSINKKIDTFKTVCLISGIILLIVYYAGNNSLEKAMNEKLKELNISANTNMYSIDDKLRDSNYRKVSIIRTDYQFYSTVISVIAKAIGLLLCGYLGKYVKGYWLIWAILGLFFPYPTLILIGFIPVKNEFKQLT